MTQTDSFEKLVVTIHPAGMSFSQVEFLISKLNETLYGKKVRHSIFPVGKAWKDRSTTDHVVSKKISLVGSGDLAWINIPANPSVHIPLGLMARHTSLYEIPTVMINVGQSVHFIKVLDDEQVGHSEEHHLFMVLD